MLILSRLKLILLCTIIPTLVLILGSLTNYNNDMSSHNVMIGTVPVEVKPVAEVEIIQPIKLKEATVAVQHPKTLKEQIQCMAHNIYYEAGGEPYMGQVAVARVVMNRVRHGFAANPCLVIYQKHQRTNPETDKTTIHCQFSWVCQGKKSPDVSSDRYKTAEEIAHLVLTEDKWRDDFHGDVLFFHNHTVNPRWPYKRSFTIGNHTFYAKN